LLIRHDHDSAVAAATPADRQPLNRARAIAAGSAAPHSRHRKGSLRCQVRCAGSHRQRQAHSRSSDLQLIGPLDTIADDAITKLGMQRRTRAAVYGATLQRWTGGTPPAHPS